MNNKSISTSYPSRLILDGIPRAGYDVHLSPFPGSLYAVLEYLGDRCDYDYLMGVTGAAFRRLWNRDDGGNVDLSKFGDTPFRLVFDALGYDWHTVPAEMDAMLTAIKESLNRGVPPISFGILGPPEAGIVAGYEQDGTVLYGWSYFQPDRSRYYEKSDWFETMDTSGGRALVVIGSKKSTTPAEVEVIVASLEWAIDLERTSNRSEIPDHVSGLAAYDAWAGSLEVDSGYPPENSEVMGTRTMIYGDQCVMLEERHEAARFLRRMKAFAPQAAVHLEDAATFYNKVGDLTTPLWPWPIDPNAGAMQALADARTRRELAGYIRTAKEKETQAVVYLEKALEALK
jgi:hypothetical protein